MKKNFLQNKKKFFVTLALAVGIVGVATTMAILTSATNPVRNSFSLAQDVTTEIEEELDPRPVAADTDLLKKPVVVNTGKSNAYIRARVTVTPSDAGVELFAGDWNEKTFTKSRDVLTNGTFQSNDKWIYNSEDGWYYYTVVTSPNENDVNHKTASIFDAVKLKSSADVTIYQEAVYAPKAAGTEATVAEIKAEFDKLEN